MITFIVFAAMAVLSVGITLGVLISDSLADKREHSKSVDAEYKRLCDQYR